MRMNIDAQIEHGNAERGLVASKNPDHGWH
jgi:hypothetical protein